MEDRFSSSSDEDVDEAELEEALYSQIHFGSASVDSYNSKELQSKLAEPSFQVQVKSLLLKKKRSPMKPKEYSNVKPPVYNQDYISFNSNSEAKTLSSKNKESLRKSECRVTTLSSSNKPFHEDPSCRSESNCIENLGIKNDKKQADNALCENDEDDCILVEAVLNLEQASRGDVSAVSRSKHCEENRNTIESYQNIDKAQNNSEKNVPEESQILSQETLSQETMPPNLFPFSITRVLRRDPELSVSAPTEEQNREEVTAVNGSRKQSKKLQNKPTVANKARLEEFLELSATKSNEDSVLPFKKKKVSKQDAAVQPRKPPVLLRRPPTVVVRYHQDSDTNTEYSDSDESKTLTPRKVKGKDKQVKLQKLSQNKVKEDNVSSFESSMSSDEDEVEIIADPDGDKEVSFCFISSCDESEDDDKSMDTDASSSEDDLESEEGPVYDSEFNFNIDGGLETLHKPEEGGSDGKWAINEEDRFTCKVLRNRYFQPKSFKCFNCKEEGHLAVDCTKEKKLVCFMCGDQGHLNRRCPNAICYQCDTPGHRSNDCLRPKRNWRDSYLEKETKKKKKKSKVEGNSVPKGTKRQHGGEEGEMDKRPTKRKMIELDTKQSKRKTEKVDNLSVQINLSHSSTHTVSKKRKKEEDLNPKHKKHQSNCMKVKHLPSPPTVSKAERGKDVVRKGSKSQSKCVKDEIDELNLQINLSHSLVPTDSKREVFHSERQSREYETGGVPERAFVEGNTRYTFQEPVCKFSSSSTEDDTNTNDYQNKIGVTEKNFSHNNNFSYDEPKKGLKSKQKQGRWFEMDDDLWEDVSHHQVSHNKWWDDRHDDDFDSESDPEIYVTASRKDRRKEHVLKRKMVQSSSPCASDTRDHQSEPSDKRFKGHPSHHHGGYEPQPYHYHHSSYSYHAQEQHDAHYTDNYIPLNFKHHKQSKTSYPYRGGNNSNTNSKRGSRYSERGFKARGWRSSYVRR